MAHEDVASIHLLKSLFAKCNGDSSDSEAEDVAGGSQFGPDSFKPKKGETKTTLENLLLKKIDEDSAFPKSMEEWQEQQAKDEEELDTRKKPEYSVAYKQAVTSEDIYLQMGFKTPSTASCEDMIVEIQLPEETVGIDRMQLDVEAEQVSLQTPVYRLLLPLPHKINPKKGRAEYY